MFRKSAPRNTGGSFDAWLAEAFPAAPNPIGLGQGPGMPHYTPVPVSPYHYLPGKTGDGAGVGVDDMALVQPTTLPIDSIYAPRYNVRKSLAPQAPGYVKLNQEFVPVDLLANGVYFSGTFLLTSLSGAGNIAPGNS